MIKKSLKLSLFIILILLFVGCSSTQKINILLNQANDFTNQKEYSKAIELYQQALTKNPNNEILMYNLALVAALDHQYQYSLSLLDKLVALDDSYLKTYLEIAKISEDHKVVESLLLQQAEQQNNYLDLITFYEEQNRFKEAYEVALKAFELNLYSNQLFEKLVELAEDKEVWQVIYNDYSL